MKQFHLLIIFSFLCVNVLAQTFADPNFTAIPVGSGWNAPAGAVFSKDGQKLFVWERAGKLYVCNRDGSGNYIKQAQPVADISEEVADWDAHGMLGFAMDPNFENNGLIYLLYVVDRHHLLNFGTGAYSPNITITGQATIGRVTRYQTTTSGSNLIVNTSTRQILIGETKSTGMPILHHSHGVGTLAFAADGTLLVTIGDAASYEGIDAGSFGGTFYQQALADGIITAKENVGAFRSQLVNSMSGKLLRIDPQTGNGVPSNPFYSASEPRAPRSRVWALGIRNSFRMFIKPGTGSTDPAVGDIGEVYLGDVGFASWEEMNICKAPGTNFGWPIYEGNEYTIPLDGGLTYKDLNVENKDEPNPLFGTGGCTQQFLYFRQLIKQVNVDDNKTLYNPCNSSVAIGTGNRYYHRRPALEWSHAHPWARVGIFNGNTPAVAMIGSGESQVVGSPFSGQCSVGGTLYTGNNFPAQYKNTYLQADFAGSWIKRVSVDFTDVVTRVDDFASGYTEIVCITQNPIDGTLITVQIGSSTGVKKVQYGGNQPPVAKPTANVTYGTSPLSVNFNGGNSFDPSPGGSIISYAWNFGGANPATSNVANPGNIIFTDNTGNPKKFVVKLTVTDNGGATHTDSVIVSVNNTPPVVNITSPIKNSLYKQGSDTVYACTATVSDAQHSGAQLKYEWQTTLRHNNHEHREAIDNAVNTNTLIQRVGFYGSDVYYWLVELKVTDAAGLSTKDSAKIFPDRPDGDDVTSPLVLSVSPVNGATGVATNTIVSAIFNEAIDESTLNGTTVQLKNGASVIAASVTTSTNQVTLTPSAALNESTVYTATIKGGASGVTDAAGNALANDYNWIFTTTGSIDNTPPTVSNVSPLNGATGVSTGASVIVNFSETINAATVTGTTVQLKNGATVIAAGLNTSSGQITLTPSALLSISTVYTVTIKGGASGVKDAAGNALANDYSWSFTTGTTSQSPVTIQSFTTRTGASPTVHSLTGIPAGALLVLATTADAVPSDCIVSSVPSLSWTKRSDAGATNSDNAEIWTAVYAAGGSISVTSNWGADASQASVCYVVLNAESALSGAFATAVSQAAPSVTITTTRDNSIIFGCTADWKAVNGATRTLRDAATERLYFRDGSYTTYYYTKAAATVGAYTEGVSLPTGQQASTALLEIRGATVTVDIIPPTVSSVTPVNGAAGVPVSTTATAIFNEAMDATTINGSTIELRNPSNTLIAATISYNAGSRTATLTPSVALTNSTVYTATVKSGTTGVKDVAGNALASDYNWSFTTEAGDIIPPTVSSVTPVNGATGVSANTNVSAIFNEAMNATTINGSTIEIRNPSNALITAAVSYNAGTRTATVTPSVALANSTIYTATVKSGTTGVKDAAGNALVSDYNWSFTTVAPDLTSPTVSSISPLNGATGVSVSTTVTANFSEAINASTVTTSTVQLRNSANTLITATVSVAGNQIVLTPSATLTASTVYTATITGGASGVKDLAGNALTGSYSWSFTTGAVASQPVTIQSFTTITGASPTVHALTAVPAGALLVLATTADAVPSDCIVSSVPSLSWTKRSDAGATNSDNAEIWTAVYSAGGSITVTSNWGADASQASVCYVVLNAEPTLGGAFATAISQASPSVTITTTRDNSIIFGCTADWKAVNGATRTLRDVATERLYFRDGNYTTYYYTKAAATVGAYTEGVSIPTGQQASTALLEIRGNAVAANIPPTVTTQPASQTRCAGINASFTAAASGTPVPTVQWQESANGTSWTNINGATNSSLTFTTTIADNNKQYRSVWTNDGSSVNSDPATLTVNSIPGSPSVTVVNNCGNSVLTAGSFSGALLWSNGATTASVTATTAGAYTVNQTVNGCTSAAGIGTAAPKGIPQLSGSLAATATSGTVFTYNPASSIAGTTFAWSRATVTGISNAAANGTGSVSETLNNTTSSPVNITYVYTLTANGCTNTQNVVVTINPVPAVNCTINNTSLATNFNATAIPAGRYIWFNSSFDPGPLGAGTDAVTINITNSVISFTANNVQYNLNVPNARIRFDAAVTSASTQFINNVWETVVPRSYTNDVFMSGLSYLVPVNFPGNYTSVTWKNDISIDKAGISLGWRWAAAVYTTFAGHAGINVKPINGSTRNPYANSDRAGTPDNFKSFVVNGAKGTGGTNYTGSFSTIYTATCTNTPGQRSPLQPAITQQLFFIDSLSKKKLDIDVIPNPTTTHFNLVIRSSNNNPVRVKITNILGQVMEIHEKIAVNTVLPVGRRWSAGSYFVEILQDGQRKFMKIIKVN